jgi:hypothetical protein
MLALLYISFRPALKRKRDPMEKPFSISPAQQRDVERQMNNVLVEMATMARQISAQIDTRAVKLEALIKEADAKITRLKRLSEGETPQEATAILPAAQKARDDARHTEVYTLADQGVDAVEIAKRIGRQRGEVELILALRGK